FQFAKLSGTPLVSQDARARRVAQRAQIPTEVRPLVLRTSTKRLGSQSAVARGRGSDRVRLMGRGRRRLAPASEAPIAANTHAAPTAHFRAPPFRCCGVT